MTKKSRKKCRAVSTEDLPFWQKRQKLAIKKKVEEKGGPVTIGLRPVLTANALFFFFFAETVVCTFCTGVRSFGSIGDGKISFEIC